MFAKHRPTPGAASPLPLKVAPPAAGQSPIRGGRAAVLVLWGSLCFGVPARAQDSDGEVRKIDKAQSKITLRHGEIKKLDMPPMTMVFRVKDAKLLDAVVAGDKVRFTAEQIDGHYVVTALVKAPS